MCTRDDLTEDRRYGEDHLGPWEGLEVFRWAFSNADSVLIADAGKLLGVTNEVEIGDLEFNVDDRDHHKHVETLRLAENEKDPDKIPKPSDIGVVGTAKLVPRLGLRDVHAGLRLPLDLTSLGYALNKDDKVYHRPDCPLLDGQNVIYSLSIWADDSTERSPCTSCNPCEWDQEGIALS